MSADKTDALEKLFLESENQEKRLETLIPLLEKKPLCREKLLLVMQKMENRFPETSVSFKKALKRLQEMLKKEESFESQA
ncbi:MAG: hypothetical protein R6W70_02255 [bacterium]